MKSSYLILLPVVFFYFSSAGYAQKRQDIKFGKVSPEDFRPIVSPVVDSNTNAVIISDMGVTDFEGNKNGWLNHIFKRRTRIRILNRKGIDLASVKVSLYKLNETEEKLEDLSASTYNLVNGQVVETKLGRDDIFTEKEDRNWVNKKFTLPAVVENSIIEYSYTINSEFSFTLPSWEFQNINYPCLWSQYELTIPGLLGYTLVNQTFHPFAVEKSENGRATYRVVQPADKTTYGAQETELTVGANTTKYTWAMKEVPAFYVENYISSPVNYIDKISFQLSKTYNGEDTRNVMDTWPSAIDRLLTTEDFGGALNEKNIQVETLVNTITRGSTDQLANAKNIFNYLKTNFTCTNYYNKYITTSLWDVVKKRSGSVGEINLLLTFMLRHAGVSADPVLLSTREFGLNYPSYPVLSRLNYVICKAVINDHAYFLDASHSYLGFGRLPGNCYNGHARVISKVDTAAVYFNPGSLEEPKVTRVSLFDNGREPGNYVGKFQSSYGYQQSCELRKSIDRKNMKELFGELSPSGCGEVELTDTGIDSLDNVEEPVSLHYDFKLKPEATGDYIYINPLLGFGYKKNPFAAAERKYPVEMPYPIDETFVLYMQVPDGYAIEETPKSMKANFNETEGFFEYLVQKTDKVIQLRAHLKMNKAIFEPDEYNTLRDFFSFVVKKQSEQVVFKKVR